MQADTRRHNDVFVPLAFSGVEKSLDTLEAGPRRQGYRYRLVDGRGDNGFALAVGHHGARAEGNGGRKTCQPSSGPLALRVDLRAQSVGHHLHRHVHRVRCSWAVGVRGEHCAHPPPVRLIYRMPVRGHQCVCKRSGAVYLRPADRYRQRPHGEGLGSRGTAGGDAQLLRRVQVGDEPELLECVDGYRKVVLCGPDILSHAVERVVRAGKQCDGLDRLAVQEQLPVDLVGQQITDPVVVVGQFVVNSARPMVSGRLESVHVQAPGFFGEESPDLTLEVLPNLLRCDIHDLSNAFLLFIG